MISTNSRHRKTIAQLMSNGELPLGYIAGIIDAKGSLTVNIDPRDSYALGYHVEPRLRVSTTDESLIGLLDAYAESRGIMWRIEEQSDERYVWVVAGVDNVGPVLAEVYPYVLEQNEKFEYYLEEILPFIDSGEWQSKEGLIRLAEMIGEAGGTSSRRKYTPEYFREEFGLA